ncbi:MAG: hypothetical protein JNL81_10335 [Hyphomonadaceae bacterium]|nr:hypothetical protein [Hyphomonadaceae bacterium]
MGFWVQKAAAALIALTLIAGPSASAQPDLRDYLTQQLDNQEPDNAERGFAHAVGPLAGSLASARAAQLPLTLRVGQEIRIVGVCDRTCGDLDLRVLNPRGEIVAQDVRGNDHPVVDLRAEMFGQHTIEVGMIDCDAPRCRYAVNVYTR